MMRTHWKKVPGAQPLNQALRKRWKEKYNTVAWRAFFSAQFYRKFSLEMRPLTSVTILCCA